MTIGSKVGFPGECVPQVGESEIRQSGSTGVDIVTITLNSSQTSTAGSRAIMVSRQPTEKIQDEQPVGANTVFEVAYDGARAWRHVKALPVSATTYSVSATESGVTFMCAAASAIVVTLPAQEAGLNYEFLLVGTCASGVSVVGATAGEIVYWDDVAANSVLIGASAVGEGGGARFISNGTKWFCITEPAFSSAAPTTATATYYNVVT